VIGGDIADFISTNLEKREPAIVKEIVNFVDEVVNSAKSDTKIASFLSEVILGLYDSGDKSKYNLLRSKLSADAQEYFDYSISLWLKGNPEVE
jgi:hypothetical protein